MDNQEYIGILERSEARKDAEIAQLKHRAEQAEAENKELHERLTVMCDLEIPEIEARAEQAEAALAEAEAKYMPIHEFINGAIDAYEEIMGQRTDISPDRYQAGREIVESIANEWVAERRRVQQAEAERDYLAEHIATDCNNCLLFERDCPSCGSGATRVCIQDIINYARTQVRKEIVAGTLIAAEIDRLQTQVGEEE